MSDYMGKNSVGKLLGLLKEKLDEKVSKEIGKGLSTNDFTNEEKEKLEKVALNFESGFTPTNMIKLIKGVHYFDSIDELPDAGNEGAFYLVKVDE